MGGDEFCVLAAVEPARAETVVALAAAALTDTGDAFSIGCSHGMALVPSEAFSPGRRAAHRRPAHVRAEVEPAGGEPPEHRCPAQGPQRARQRAARAISAAWRGLAERIAERLGLDAHEIKLISLAAKLHDVGKTAIPDEILNKPGPLDQDEWEFMRSHTVIGERIILAAPSLAPSCRPRALEPRALRRHRLSRCAGRRSRSRSAPASSRSAMPSTRWSSQRPYRAAMSPGDAVAELRRCAGTQFDPAVVEAFCAVAEESDTAGSAA